MPPKATPKSSARNAPPTPTSPVRSSKRKPRSPTPDSDVHTVSVVKRAKRVKRVTTPPPGSPEFTELPPVTFATESEDEIFRKIPGLKFGSVDDDTNEPSTPTKRTPSSRNKTKTEKARVQDDTPTRNKESAQLMTPKPTPTKPKSSRQDADASDELEPVIENADKPKSSASIQKKVLDSRPKAKNDPLPKENVNSAPESKTDQTDVTIGKGKSPLKSKHSSMAPIHVKVEPDDVEMAIASDEGDGNEDAVSSGLTSCASDDEESIDAAPEADANDDEEPTEGNDSAVMCLELQDPALRNIYLKLPLLPRFIDVEPISMYAGGESRRVQFSQLCKVLNDTAKTSLLRGLRFVQSGYFVNMARIRPKLLAAEHSYIKIASTKQLAIGIMLGVVSESFLVDVAMIGSQRSPYPIHRITIAPFPQEMRRDSSVWGLLFGLKQDIPGPINSGGFSFSTRPRTESSVEESTPAAEGGIFTTVSTSSTKTKSHPFSPSRAFEDSVPIYNGRATKTRPAFSFTTDDFSRLSKLPLYSKGQKDLSGDHVVAVGYTMGTYVNSRTKRANLSSNVQFVILLGETTAPVL